MCVAVSFGAHRRLCHLQVDQPDAPMDEYITSLRSVLRDKHRAIQALLDKITAFEEVMRSQKRPAGVRR